MKQTFEVGAITRKWTAAVLGDTRNYPFERRIEPDGSAVGFDHGAILGIDEGPTARRHDGVSKRDLLGKDGAFDAAKVWLSLLREDVRHRGMLALLDQLVDVGKPPVETLRERPPHAGLAGSHEADEVHFVGFHATLTLRAGRVCRKIPDR